MTLPPPVAPSTLGQLQKPATLEIHRIQPPEFAGTFELLASNGWRHRISDLGHFSALVEASQIADVAVLGGQIVGFVRGITDGLSNGYLSMVVVSPGHRGRGAGRRLVENAMGRSPEISWVLRAGRDGAAEFFAKLGFEASSVAMERRRAPATAG